MNWMIGQLSEICKPGMNYCNFYSGKVAINFSLQLLNLFASPLVSAQRIVYDSKSKSLAAQGRVGQIY